MRTLVVTRHAALVALLQERGIIGEGAEVLSHVSDPSVLDGAHVVGVLPFELAARAAAVTVVPLALGPEDRGVELSLDRLREIAGEATTYEVAPVRFYAEVRSADYPFRVAERFEARTPDAAQAQAQAYVDASDRKARLVGDNDPARFTVRMGVTR